MSIAHRLRRKAIVGPAAALATVIAASIVTPAGAMAAPAPPHAAPADTTPWCLVQASLLYPFFIGGVFFTNPMTISSALPAYWVGGASPAGETHGMLHTCGLDATPPH